MTRIILLAGVAALAACAPTAESVQGPDQNRFAQGAVAGAIGGAALAALTGDDSRERILSGAAIGAAVGAGLGGRLDQQEAALRQQLRGPGIGIVNNGQGIVVTFPSGLLFDTNSAELSAAARSDLLALASNLQQYPSQVRIIGHADSRGTTALNQELSERRARSVAGLLAGAGVPQARLSVTGAGETDPIADNSTAAGQQANRRVEVVITPI